MIDKELIEKITNSVGTAVAVYVGNYKSMPSTFQKTLVDNATNQILAFIQEVGYRTVSGEPPVKIKEVDIVKILNEYFPYLGAKDNRNKAAYEIRQLFETSPA